MPGPLTKLFKHFYRGGSILDGQEESYPNVSDGKQPFQVRLPGFVNEQIGLGDAIKRATSTLGIKPCGGCTRRAAKLNKWLVFTGGRGY